VPVPFQLIHREGFIVADVGIFAEDYEYVPGYGDLDFFNGTDSYLPDRAASAYHYVTPFDAKVTDADRKKKAMFPYYVGIQFKSKADAFNDLIDQSEKVRFFRANRGDLTTVFDLGTVGKAADGKSVPGSVPDVWQREIINGN